MSASGWCTAGALREQDREERAQERADARTTRDDQQLRAEGGADRRPLALGQHDPLPRLDPGERLLRVDHRPWRRPRSERPQPLGDDALGMPEVRKEHAAALAGRVGAQLLGRELEREGVDEDLARNAQERLRELQDRGGLDAQSRRDLVARS